MGTEHLLKLFDESKLKDMELKWGTCGDNGAWCGFLTVNIDNPSFNEKEGVYIIWQKKGTIIRVGKGRIRDKIIEDRKNEDIIQDGNLLVTWAIVSSQNKSGVEKYLVNRLKPKVSNDLTDASPITVNLPWPY